MRRHRKGMDAVDLWIDEQTPDVLARVSAAGTNLAGHEASEIVEALRSSGINAPDDILRALAARMSCLPRWAFDPDITEYTTDDGRTHKITNRAHFRVTMRPAE